PTMRSLVLGEVTTSAPMRCSIRRLATCSSVASDEIVTTSRPLLRRMASTVMVRPPLAKVERTTPVERSLESTTFFPNRRASATPEYASGLWRGGRWVNRPSMAAVQDSIRQAIAHHRSGRLAEAEALYRQVLSVEPTNPDALQLLGVVALQSGNAAA